MAAMSAFATPLLLPLFPKCTTIYSFRFHQERRKHFGLVSQSRLPIVSRMRNRGGFKPPPRIPNDETELQRSIQLLGNLTQRGSIRASIKREIESLCGGFPKSREAAQRWKGALQYRINARTKHLSQPHSFRNRIRILKFLRLPEDNDQVGRCFALLGSIQKKYRLNQISSSSVAEELTELIGGAPSNERDAHHYIKTLVHLQKQRQKKERKPPIVPMDSMEELEYVRMILGTFAVTGSAGEQNERLENIIGSLPRNKNIAASWKKVIEAVIRRKRRREKSERRRQEISLKRLQRRLKRQSRQHDSGIIQTMDTTGDSKTSTEVSSSSECRLQQTTLYISNAGAVQPIPQRPQLLTFLNWLFSFGN